MSKSSMFLRNIICTFRGVCPHGVIKSIDVLEWKSIEIECQEMKSTLE
jgi:hypothetical protein